MLQPARERLILNLLREQGECSVDALAKTLHVSDMTIRRDLQRLADAGQLIRTHGGAAPLDPFDPLKEATLSRACDWRSPPAPSAALLPGGFVLEAHQSQNQTTLWWHVAQVRTSP